MIARAHERFLPILSKYSGRNPPLCKSLAAAWLLLFQGMTGLIATYRKQSREACLGVERGTQVPWSTTPRVPTTAHPFCSCMDRARNGKTMLLGKSYRHERRKASFHRYKLVNISEDLEAANRIRPRRHDISSLGVASRSNAPGIRSTEMQGRLPIRGARSPMRSEGPHLTPHLRPTPPTGPWPRTRQFRTHRPQSTCATFFEISEYSYASSLVDSKLCNITNDIINIAKNSSPPV